MKIYNLAAGFLLTVGMAAQAHADSTVFGELGLAIDSYSAGGNGVNTSGFPFDEPDRFRNLSAFGELGAVYDNGVAVALSARYGETNVSDFNSFGAPSNDGPKSSGQAVLTIGYLQPNYFVGGFAGIGKVRFVGFDADQDATYQLLGLGASFKTGAWSHGVSFSLTDVTETDDFETLNKTTVLKLQSEYDFDNGDTQIGLIASLLDGEMDWDGRLADPVEGGSFGVYVRHKVGTLSGNNPLVMHAGIARTMLNEAPPSADHSLYTTKLHIGFSVEFGKRARPSLMRVAAAPDMTTAQMFNPMLD
jgi:hypothetical protein